MTILETNGLTKRYGSLTAVDHVSLSVEKGQVFGFLGPNGSGKTTTIGMLLGIITPTGGTFRMFGRDGERRAARVPPAHRRHARNAELLPVPQRPRQPARRGADQGRRPRTASPKRSTSSDSAGRQRDAFRKYSLGMKQRLALAATMLGDPELIILDEPANGLDPEGMREVREIILALAARGATIFLSSHLLWEVERTCTHVAILRSGQSRQAERGARPHGGSNGRVGRVERRRRRCAASSPSTRQRPAPRNGTAGCSCTWPTTTWPRSIVMRTSAGSSFSHLAVERRTLEDAFIEATAPDAGGVA